jgi:anaerobic selenocysteine-containing dehydrogenase
MHTIEKNWVRTQAGNQPKEVEMDEEVEIKKAVCHWCKGECGVLVHVKDGRMIKLEADPDWPRPTYPTPNGCGRLRAGIEWFYHPDRLKFPVKRVGERGEGKWQPISWEQALDEIAERLTEIRDKYGSEAIGYTAGTGGRTDHTHKERFFRMMGMVNSSRPSAVCFGPRCQMADAIVGMFPHYSVKPTTRCIVMIGAELLIARPIVAHNLREAKKRGAKTIVIDPQRTRSAAEADVWLQLRPGTDCALLMGMVNVMINEDLYDKQFVDNWCYGFDELKERAAEYPLDVVERITEVPTEKIREAARVYAANRPGCMIEGMGIEELPSNAEIIHARWILAALAGNIDVEGGEELTGPHPKMLTPGEIEPRVYISPEQLSKQIGGDRFKFLSRAGQQLIVESMRKVWPKSPRVIAISHGPSMYRAILTGKPYPVRAVITSDSNPMVTQGNTKLVYKALKSLDLYVVIDFWMTPTAELADYVLPPACWLERPTIFDQAGYGNYVFAAEAPLPNIIPGEYEHMVDFDIYRELATRLGQGDLWPWKNEAEFYDDMLKPTGYTHKEYANQVHYEHKVQQWKKYEETGFGTPTGKVELYSTILEKLGYDPLPRYREPAETPVSDPELAKEYPLVLITGGRFNPMYHSEWRQIDSARRRRPYPLLHIHPDTAAKLDIAEGDWVWIESPRGRVRQKAFLFSGIKPDVVHAEHGWWYPELPGEEPWLHGVWECNINVLTDDDPDVCDPLTGAWPLRTAMCRVYKVKQY